MIIPKHNRGQATEIIAGDSEGVDAGIDVANLGFVLDIVSNKMYSNPIGSLIREITSNCFDSHIEAGVELGVKVSLKYNLDEGYYMEFEDFGVGISRDRMKKVYSRYFSSTKRDSNDQLGMWGLGSKSPLSYTDSFIVLTRFEGIEYLYIVHKGVKIPRIEFIYDEPTDKPNGSCVKVPVKPSDTLRFKQETRKQLSFFKNVIFEGLDIPNDYKIYETETFRYRNDFQFSNMLHLCIGDVTYPIDWDELDIPPLMIPVAIRFGIGEIMVNPQREAIRYDEGVKEAILKRIDDVIAEMIAMYNDTIDNETDLDVYIKKNIINKQPYRQLTLIEEKDDEEGVFIRLDDLYNKINVKDQGSPNDKYVNTFYTKYAGLINEPTVTHLAEKGIKIPDNFLFFINHTHYIDKKKEFIRYSDAKSITASYVLNLDDLIVANIGSDNNIVKNEFVLEDGRKLLGATIQKPTTKRVYIKYKELLGIHKHSLGTGRKIKFYIDYIMTYLYSEGMAINYKTPLDEEWLEKRRERLEEEKRIKKEEQKNRTDVPILRFLPDKTDATKDIWQKEAIAKYTGVIIYGYKKDYDLLKLTCDLVYKYWKRFSNNQNRIYIIQISEKNKKHINYKQNAIKVNKFYMTQNRILKRILSAIDIRESEVLKILTPQNMDLFEEVNRDVYQSIKFLMEFDEEYGRVDLKKEMTLATDLREEMLALARANNIKDYEMDMHLNKIKKFFLDCKLLKFVTINENSIMCVAEFMKLKKKRVNYIHYLTVDKIINLFMRTYYNYVSLLQRGRMIPDYNIFIKMDHDRVSLILYFLSRGKALGAVDLRADTSLYMMYEEGRWKEDLNYIYWTGSLKMTRIVRTNVQEEIQEPISVTTLVNTKNQLLIA